MTASFDDILGNLYEATSDPDFWITALGAIADLLHAQYATILLRTSAVADDGLAISVDESRRQVEPIRMALP
ncbi:MAG TPA: hypothetical protein VFQ88_10145, partial [Nevskiaceae bacterium]|nr:hypothetical protein [Nevskiaceae bacterium]